MNTSKHLSVRSALASAVIAASPTLLAQSAIDEIVITARGISQHRNSEMSVAVLMDGVLMVTPTLSMTPRWTCA